VCVFANFMMISDWEAYGLAPAPAAALAAILNPVAGVLGASDTGDFKHSSTAPDML